MLDSEGNSFFETTYRIENRSCTRFLTQEELADLAEFAAQDPQSQDLSRIREAALAKLENYPV